MVFNKVVGVVEYLSGLFDEELEDVVVEGDDVSGVFCGDFVFDGICYFYGEMNVFCDVDLCIFVGKVMVFVGFSGGGKMMILLLFECFYVLLGGCLFFGDCEVFVFELELW